MLNMLMLGFGMGLGVMTGFLALFAVLLLAAAILLTTDWILERVRKPKEGPDTDETL